MIRPGALRVTRCHARNVGTMEGWKVRKLERGLRCGRWGRRRAGCTCDYGRARWWASRRRRPFSATSIDSSLCVVRSCAGKSQGVTITQCRGGSPVAQAYSLCSCDVAQVYGLCLQHSPAHRTGHKPVLRPLRANLSSPAEGAGGAPGAGNPFPLKRLAASMISPGKRIITPSYVL